MVVSAKIVALFHRPALASNHRSMDKNFDVPPVMQC
jgi:hypothetical protein